jgi:HK97 family phage major capsid protein
MSNVKNIGEMDLDELYSRGDQLRSELAELPASERTDTDQARIRAIAEEAESLDTHITLAELATRREGGAPGAAGQVVATSGGIRGFGGNAGTPGELIVTEELVDWVMGREERYLRSLEGVGTLDGMLTRAVAEWGTTPATYDASGAGNLLPVGQPIAPIPRQARLYLRDLIPTMTTTLAAIPYVQELNPTLYESASAVAEGGAKPNATLSFTGQKADPTVLAATLVISKQLFEDAAAVVQYINQRLPYIVKFKEDAELLNGSGTWPDIQGILQTSGVQTQGGVSSDDAQTLAASFAKVELHDGAPTAVVLNPTQAWNMFSNRAAGGSGTFDAGTPFSALPLTVWGVPSYRTRAIAAGSALVGDFQLGAMIADREEVNIETYRERYAEQNQILLVCEERIGLMVFRPDLFVNVTLPN